MLFNMFYPRNIETYPLFLSTKVKKKSYHPNYSLYFTNFYAAL